MRTYQMQLRRTSPDVELNGSLGYIPQLPLRVPQRYVLPAQVERSCARLIWPEPLELVETTQPDALALREGDVLSRYELLE